MNTGAAIASGDVLIFLHADTRLPDDAFDAIERVLAAIATGSPVVPGAGKVYRFPLFLR